MLNTEGIEMDYCLLIALAILSSIVMLNLYLFRKWPTKGKIPKVILPLFYLPHLMYSKYRERREGELKKISAIAHAWLTLFFFMSSILWKCFSQKLAFLVNLSAVPIPMISFIIGRKLSEGKIAKRILGPSLPWISLLAIWSALLWPEPMAKAFLVSFLAVIILVISLAIILSLVERLSNKEGEILNIAEITR